MKTETTISSAGWAHYACAAVVTEEECTAHTDSCGRVPIGIRMGFDSPHFYKDLFTKKRKDNYAFTMEQKWWAL